MKLEVGALSESITVTGESPTVDVKSNVQQTVMNQAIEDLLKNPSRAEQMGRAGRKAVFERCNNKREIHKLISFYSKVLGGQPHGGVEAAN